MINYGIHSGSYWFIVVGSLWFIITFLVGDFNHWEIFVNQLSIQLGKYKKCQTTNQFPKLIPNHSLWLNVNFPMINMLVHDYCWLLSPTSHDNLLWTLGLNLTIHPNRCRFTTAEHPLPSEYWLPKVTAQPPQSATPAKLGLAPTA